MLIADKIALVTGAASGIGKATAIVLADHGATVVVADIDDQTAQGVVATITMTGGSASALKLDVADDFSWKQAIDRTLKQHGKLNILVNNAGLSFAKPVVEMTHAEWRKVMAVNLDGVFLGTKHAIAAMRGGGSIINVASVSGIKPSPGASAYCASKAAIRMFSKTAAIECCDAGNGVRVNVVTPGGVRTAMWEQMDFFKELVEQHGSVEKAFAAIEGQAPSQRFFAPEEVARTILYLAADESAHLTGVEIILDRGHVG